MCYEHSVQVYVCMNVIPGLVVAPASVAALKESCDDSLHIHSQLQYGTVAVIQEHHAQVHTVHTHYREVQVCPVSCIGRKGKFFTIIATFNIALPSFTND